MNAFAFVSYLVYFLPPPRMFMWAFRHSSFFLYAMLKPQVKSCLPSARLFNLFCERYSSNTFLRVFRFVPHERPWLISTRKSLWHIRTSTPIRALLHGRESSISPAGGE